MTVKTKNILSVLWIINEKSPQVYHEELFSTLAFSNNAD
jgi:hypothetical protein